MHSLTQFFLTQFLETQKNKTVFWTQPLTKRKGSVYFNRPHKVLKTLVFTGFFLLEISLEEAFQCSTMSGIVTSDMVSGVLDEIVGLLPVIIPVMIGFIGLRKGISFLQGVLHSA